MDMGLLFPFQGYRVNHIRIPDDMSAPIRVFLKRDESRVMLCHCCGRVMDRVRGFRRCKAEDLTVAGRRTFSPNQKLSVAGTFGILEGGATPTHYTVFQGGDQTGAVTYTLPTAAPASNGQVLSATTLGVMSWASVQAADATLTGIAALAPTANQMLYATGADTFATTALTTAGRALLDDADASAQRTTLGLGDVQNVNVQNAFTQNDSQYIATDQIRARDPSGLRLFEDSGTSGILLKDDGNVGIGTTNLSSRLHVASPSTNTWVPVAATAVPNITDLVVENTTRGSDSWAGIYLKTGRASHGSTTADARIAVLPTAQIFSSDIAFSAARDYDSRLYERMRIQGDTGNVGIGTTSPGARLHVAGHSSVLWGQVIVDGQNSYDPEISFSRSGSAKDWSLVSRGATGQFQVQLSNTPYFSINSSGNVGIGTTSPTALLHVANGAGQLENNTNNVLGQSLIFKKSRGTGATPTAVSSADDIAYLKGMAYVGATNGYQESSRITMDTEGTIADTPGGAPGVIRMATVDSGGTLFDRVLIDSDGNVGIGTTNPTAKLEVSGTAGVDGIKFPDGTLQTTAAGGAVVLLETKTASNSSEITFTSNIDSTYTNYEIRINNVIPATNNTQLRLQVSTDGGSSWKSGATDYRYSVAELSSVNGGWWSDYSSGTTSINLSRTGLGTAAGSSYNCTLTMHSPSTTNTYKTFRYDYSANNSFPDAIDARGSGHYVATTAVNAIRLYMSSGNITSGTFKLYGIK